MINGHRALFQPHPAVRHCGLENQNRHRPRRLFIDWVLEIIFKASCLLFYFIFGSQNHTGFRYTTQWNIICTLHRVPIAPSKVSLCPSLPYFARPLPLVVTALLNTCYKEMCYIHVIIVSMYDVYIFLLYLLSSFTFFHPVPKIPFDSCQSVPCIHHSVSTLFIGLFCLLNSTCK